MQEVTKKKRILIFSLAYYPSHVSGAETAIKDTTDRIRPEEITFHMVTKWYDKSQPKIEQVGNVLVHRVGGGSSYFSKAMYIPMAAAMGATLHRKYQYDGLWAMMTYMLIPVVFMRLIGIKIPYALSLQDGDTFERVFERWQIKPVVPLLRYGFRSATIVQVISQYLATWPEKLGYKGTIEIIYDGANPQSIHPDCSGEEIQTLRDTFTQNPDDVLLMNTARLVHQKAADVTIKSLLLLPEHVKLVLVGDGIEREKLEALTKEHSLTHRVIFTGNVDRTVVSTYRFAADIFVGPSRSEGLGHAFLSAMACRLPVVTTQVGGIADFIFDAQRNPDKETTGWAVDPDSPEQIARAVTYIMEHPQEVEIVVDRARKMVEEQFDWDVITKDMQEKVFNKVVNA
ncbi:MAG: glycosyltransferase involved in cell wall biosynthesis [Acidimicrobiales bacterium]|jgi:glycosyltransferase involved in cell wall biosynthesis